MMAREVIKLIKVDTKTNCGLINIQSLLKHSTTALLVIGSLEKSPVLVDFTLHYPSNVTPYRKYIFENAN